MEQEKEESEGIDKAFSSEVIGKIKDLMSFFSATEKPEDLIDETTENLQYIKEKTQERINNIDGLLSMTNNSIRNEKNQVENLEHGIKLLDDARTRSDSEKLKQEIEERKRYIKILTVRKQMLNSQLFLLKQYKDMISENLDAIEELGKEK